MPPFSVCSSPGFQNLRMRGGGGGEMHDEEVAEEFEAMTRDAGRVQRETLERILEENGRVEYLQEVGLDGRTDAENFRARVPLVDHRDLEPYIRRIADGDPSPILTSKPITAISLSSGTTEGKPKYLPFNDDLMESTMQIYRTNFAFRNREFPIMGGRALLLIYGSKQSKTRGGLPVGTATTNVYRNPKFKETMRGIGSAGCSPDEVVFAPDYEQSLYCHLLCALILREDVQFVFSTFVHTIVAAFRALERLWEELCVDIRDGVLSARVTSPSVREAVSERLRPDPDLATLVRDMCLGLSNWYGVIPALFPNSRYVHGIMTGSMHHYLKKMRHYAGELPLLSGDYGATEGWIAVNVAPRMPPESAVFAVLPNVGYFEFIPLSAAHPSTTLGLTEVRVGEEYEIVITNSAGLYRYKLGDVVKVTGFHNSTPELRFVRRKNLLLNINIDKNTETDLQQAVEAAAALLADEKLEVADFTSQADISADPAHYVIFWELSEDADDRLLRRCANLLDQSFADAGYRSSRVAASIGPLQLRVLKKGTFHKIMEHYLTLGGTASQFKTPRCVPAANAAVTRILSANVVKAYTSTAFTR